MGAAINLSEEMKRVVLDNLVAIAETYRSAGAEVQRIICSRGTDPSVTVIGTRQETGQPIIEVEFIINQQELTFDSVRRPQSVTELVESFRGHMSVEFGFVRI